jgi:uncharacterized membrane protein HdeD (DUF308 family)
MLSGFVVALHELASWNAVFSMILGMLIGYALGSVPGLTSSIGIALIVPFTFTMSTVDSIVMLVTQPNMPAPFLRSWSTRRASRPRRSPHSTAIRCAFAVTPA